MEEALFFRILFVILYGIFASIRIFYRSQNIGRESEKQLEPISISTAFLSFAIIGYFAMIFLYLILPDYIAWSDIAFPLIVRIAGIASAIVSIFIVYSTHRTLGRQYSAKQEIQQNHELISEGIYSKIRHPMYVGFSFFSVGVSIMSSNLLLIIFAFLIALPFPWIAKREEEMLLEKFGTTYLEYMKGTGRFFPPIRKKP